MRLCILILSLLLPVFHVQANERDVTDGGTDCFLDRQQPAFTLSPVIDRTVYSLVLNRNNLYLVISKRNKTLYVFEKRCTGTSIIAAYPICLGANMGDKKRPGDKRTPESKNNIPFTICEITNSSKWCHNFGDGRGLIPAYGQWFMRLHGDYPGSGIGIHGSTGNTYSIPGRGSEGCIRLRDEDIIHLKENYAFVGMKVYIGRDVETE